MGPNISFFVAPLLAGVGVAMFGWRGVSIGMGCLTIGGGLFFLLFAKGGESPSAPLSFGGFAKALKEPKLWLFTWLAGLGIAGEFAPFSVLTLHMLNERSLSPELAALLLSTSRIAAPIALLGGGFVTTRFGVRRTLYVCLAVYALGMFCMAMPWFPVFALGLFVQPVVTALIFPPAFTFLAESFPPKDQPMYLSIGMPLAALMGAGFMPSILGIWGDLTGFSVGFAMMGCLAALSLPLLRLAPGKSRQ
jgi:MFS family permease